VLLAGGLLKHAEKPPRLSGGMKGVYGLITYTSICAKTSSLILYTHRQPESQLKMRGRCYQTDTRLTTSKNVLYYRRFKE
jgi:hypothetical protein